MRFSIGSDEDCEAPRAIEQALGARGHTVVCRGPLVGEDARWADIARRVAEDVASRAAEQGVLFCWTGTGVSIAANKVPGIRAALCADPVTATGARAWNDANILCLSLRATPPALAVEILDAWLAAQPDGTEDDQVARIERA